MRAGAPESGLHFIGDTHATSRAHIFVDVLQIILRKHHASADALDRFGNKGCDLPGSCVVDQASDVGGVMMAGARIVASPRSAIWIGSGRMVHAEAVRDVELPSAVR